MNVAIALACPQAELSARMSAAIADKWREQAFRIVSNRLREMGDDALAARLVGEREGAQSWHPGIGLAHEALATGRPQLAALQLCISEARQGDCHQLASEVGAGGGLLVDGWNVDVRGEAVVSFKDDSVSIESELGASDFEFEGGRLIPAAPRVRRPSTLQTRVLRYAVPLDSTATAGQFPWPPSASSVKKLSLARRAEFDASLVAALELLSTPGCDFEGWVDEVVDGCLMISGPRSISFSSPQLPGLIALGPQDSAVRCFEELIAQASQQHLFQLLLVSNLVQGGAEEIHYLPSRRIYLTTRRVLAHAHEHANVAKALMQISIRPECAEEAILRSEQRRVAFHAECEPILEGCRTLSASGRDLWEALRVAMGARDYGWA